MYEQLIGRVNVAFECWMDSVYGNIFNDVPWKKLFSLKRLYHLMKTVGSVALTLKKKGKKKDVPLPFS